jgi:photosystem II stability/assembly factor-like uncharacterized protein
LKGILVDSDSSKPVCSNLNPKRIEGCGLLIFRHLSSALAATAAVFCLAAPGHAETVNSPSPVRSATSWVPVGPDGGDARSFAGDPTSSGHIFLGTTNSWVYQTTDNGSTWQRLAKLSKSDDLVVRHIIVDKSDPKTLYVGAYVVDHPDGGIFISHDSGVSWTEVQGMKGQSVRALVQSTSNPKELVAGALKGVFESDDAGVTWKQISDAAISEVESIAIDPVDPHVIYSGTWHLPWKTTDDGANWHNIKTGLIDDSDVFSIIIDPKAPQTVYTSACSGIYKSLNGGEDYKKIQGIPSTARRTRVLMQDPANPAIVYAGTTEGLYRTTAAGSDWSRLTGPDVIINDVYIDPNNDKHVLLATDRSGVLMSNDQAISFKASNDGFSQRQVSALIVDNKNPQTIYVGVVNDKIYGGVFASNDSGKSWTQQSSGLAGNDVFSMAQSADGTLLAGTGHGIFRWNNALWQPIGKVVTKQEKTVTVIRHGKHVKDTRIIEKDAGSIDGRVYSLDLTQSSWFAATSNGIYQSDNMGATWVGGPVLEHKDFQTVKSAGELVLASRREGLALSPDGGHTWQPLPLPEHLTSANTIAVAPGGSLWLGGREGVFYSEDKGATWSQIKTLPISNINSLSYDSDLKRIMVTSWNSTWVLAVDEQTRNFKWWDAGWNLRAVRSLGGRLMGASLFNGVIVQPQMQGANPSSSGGQ